MDQHVVMARNPTDPETRAFFKRLGSRIAAFRREHGLTQAELAEILGCSHQQVTSYEKGRRKVPVSALPPMARAFGVSLDELVGFGDTTPRKIGRPSKLERQLSKLSKLPKSKQRVVSEMLDGLLQQAG